MKLWLPLLVLSVLGSLHAFSQNKKTSREPASSPTPMQTSPREPNQASSSNFYGQVQVCMGTEELGNEGQGIGASAFINVYAADLNNPSGPKKCDLAMAFAYEYGNNRGISFGDLRPFNMTSVPTGKTECAITEKDDQLSITVKKVKSPKSKRPAKVLVENCRMTDSGH